MFNLLTYLLGSFASTVVNVAADDNNREGGIEDVRKRSPECLEGSPADISSISSNSFFSNKRARSGTGRPRGAPFVQPQQQQMKLCGRDVNDPNESQRMDIAIANFVHSNCLPFSLTKCPKFLTVIAEAKNDGTKYLPPNQNQMSRTLLDGLYISNYDEMMRTLLLESRIFGVTIYGDGATITNTPLINILVASPNNPSALLQIVDCASQMANVKRYLINHLLSRIPKWTIFCLSFLSRDRATAPGRYEYKSCYS